MKHSAQDRPAELMGPTNVEDFDLDTVSTSCMAGGRSSCSNSAAPVSLYPTLTDTADEPNYTVFQNWGELFPPPTSASSALDVLGKPVIPNRTFNNAAGFYPSLDDFPMLSQLLAPPAAVVGQHPLQQQKLEKQTRNRNSSKRTRKWEERKWEEPPIVVSGNKLRYVDNWAWRQYGQKVVATDHGPCLRFYYKCSQEKHCTVRRWVDTIGPDTYLVYYSGGHAHPPPLRLNILAGILHGSTNTIRVGATRRKWGRKKKPTASSDNQVFKAKSQEPPPEVLNSFPSKYISAVTPLVGSSHSGGSTDEMRVVERPVHAASPKNDPWESSTAGNQFQGGKVDEEEVMLIPNPMAVFGEGMIFWELY